MTSSLKVHLHDNLCSSYNGECVDCPCHGMPCCNKPTSELNDAEISEGFDVMKEFMFGKHKR